MLVGFKVISLRNRVFEKIPNFHLKIGSKKIWEGFQMTWHLRLRSGDAKKPLLEDDTPFQKWLHLEFKFSSIHILIKLWKRT
jgi:hypothetical protein